MGWQSFQEDSKGLHLLDLSQRIFLQSTFIEEVYKLSSKLMSYVLGCVFICSFTQNLKASNTDEDSKPSKVGRRAKVPTGYKAPHSSLAVTDITENSEFQQKLKALAEEQEKPTASSSQGKKQNKNFIATSSKTSSRDNKISKKTHAKQPLVSRVPVTVDVPLEDVPSEQEDSNSRVKTMFILPEMVISPELPPVSPTILPSDLPSNTNALKRREITTLDVATFMPSTTPAKKDISTPEAEKVSSKKSSKEKTKKVKAPKTPKESKKTKEPETSPQASPSQARIGKNYSPAQLWDLVPPKRPQIIEESPLSKAKDIIAPRELYPLHILLALAAGNRKETRPNPITGTEEQVIKYNKVYIPEIKMVVGFKIMEAGTLDLLKSKLLFDNFSQDESTKILLDLLCIQGNDLSRITPTVKQKAELNIKSLTQQHWYESGIRIKRVDVEKRPGGNTLGEKFRSNYGIYEFFKDGQLIENLQIRLAFAALKD